MPNYPDIAIIEDKFLLLNKYIHANTAWLQLPFFEF